MPAQELQGGKVFIHLVSWRGVSTAGTSTTQKVGKSQPWALAGVEIDASNWVSIDQERMKQDYLLYKHTKLCENHLCWESGTKVPHCCVLAPTYSRSLVAAIISPCPCVHWLSPSPACGSTEMLRATMGAGGQPEYSAIKDLSLAPAA